MQSASDFWKRINEAQKAATEGDAETAGKILQEAGTSGTTGDAEFDVKRRELIDLIIRTYGLPVAPAVAPVPSASSGATAWPPDASSEPELAPATPQPLEGSVRSLGPISSDCEDGISLVTCAMNRTENLLKALPTWLACPEISEILIVDWSSAEPVRAALQAAGYSDPRIRVARVEGEPRWILSYAFNTGFRLARFSRVLKTDADITLKPGFFKRNRIAPGTFIAGNWRKVQKDQAHINGFFFAHKGDLAAVNGFNEFITTYGWDDDDLYERLMRHDLERRDVDTETLYHLPHSDDERVGGRADQMLSAKDEITGGTMFRIRRNRFLANVLPYWNARQSLVPMKISSETTGDIRVQRESWLPNEVPAQIASDADYYALLEMMSWRIGRSVLHLDRPQLAALTSAPLNTLSALDAEVLRASPEGRRPSPGGYVVVTVDESSIPADNPAGHTLDRIVALASAQGMETVLSAKLPALPETASAQAMALPFVPGWNNLGTLHPLSLDALAQGLRRDAGQNFTIALAQAMPAAAGDPSPASAAPAIGSGRARLFIDAQHGLGNRLRAIGSAAAVAEKTGRELVIVWHPDHHCEGRMSDLYDYRGAVLEEAFVEEAASRGCIVFNYMEIEDGAEKSAPIAPETQGDLYVRSAYVLNSPHTDWAAENRFLRSLTPVARVRELVAGVRTPNDLSAHVRMVGGTDYEHLAYESTDNWTEEGHAETDFWRRKSHFSHFMRRIDTLIGEGRAGRIFLAADKPETYEEFLAVYGDRVAYLPRELYDRSAEQLQYALADALLLGSSPLLLGSTWSSFSELAMRLSDQEMTIEMSGKDF